MDEPGAVKGLIEGLSRYAEARRENPRLSLRASASLRKIKAVSVPEKPPPGEDHRDAVLVGSGDDLSVAHGAAGLDDGAHPGLRRRVYAVAEGEEGVGG